MTAKFMLGTKGKMTQVFDEAGSVHAATIIYAAPLTVTQVKTSEKDGYTAVQVGVGTRKEKNLSKAVRGHLKDLGSFMHLRESRAVGGDLSTGEAEIKRGDKIELSVFVPG